MLQSSIKYIADSLKKAFYFTSLYTLKFNISNVLVHSSGRSAAW